MSGIYLQRKKMKLYQIDIARELNVTQGTVSKWEKNVNIPRIDSLKKLAKLFDCSIDELLS